MALNERRPAHTLPHMKPFSLVLLSRCSLTMGASFWKNGCLSGLAIVPGPLVRAYFSHSLLALSHTECMCTYIHVYKETMGLLLTYGLDCAAEL